MHKINTKQFLKYVKQQYPEYFDTFVSNKKLFQTALDIFYSQQLLIQSLNSIPSLFSQNVININTRNDTHKDNYLLIPIHIDNI
tara:strand:+ start:185 stop:436 length:252 start_codon:yes stop_codon:yes gene_type:complete